MNKKQNLLAIALSASFVLAGANVAEANDQVNAQVQNVDQASSESTNNQGANTQENKDANLPKEDKQKETQAQADSQQDQARAGEEEKKIRPRCLYR